MAVEIELFVGEVTNVAARVYARLRGAESDDDDGPIALSGKLYGPFCEAARTLPSEFAFRDLGPGASVLAEAIVPDPSSWTPHLPHLYQAEVTARRGDRTIAAYEGPFGIRRLVPRGKSFVLDGERWVIRGAADTNLAEVGEGEWHPLRHSLLVADPDESFCKVASRNGMPILAELPIDKGDGTELTASLYRLARWPAVLMAVLPTSNFSSRPKNLMLAQWFGAEELVEPASWADLVVCEVVDGEEAAGRLAGCELPAVAFRSGGPYESVAEISAACDQLQHDLAPQLDLAGYIV